MAKSKMKPFAALCFYFRKPKPWNRGMIKPQQKIKDGVTLKKIVTYLKCSNASSMLMSAFKRNKHKVSKWSAKRSFPFLKRNMEICVNAWGAYEDRFRDWLSEHIEPSQRQITNYALTQPNEEDNDSFLAAIDRIPLSPSPPPLDQPSTSRACSNISQLPPYSTMSHSERREQIFQAVFRGKPLPSKQPPKNMLKKREFSPSFSNDFADNSDMTIDYLVEEPPESITSSVDCGESIQVTRPSLRSKQSLSFNDKSSQNHNQEPLSSITEIFVNGTSSTNMKTPTIRTRTVQMARSVKRSDIVNYSDSDSEDLKKAKNLNDENHMTPITVGRYRGRFIIQSPTTEKCNRTSKKKKKHSSPPPRNTPRRSPRILSFKTKMKTKPTESSVTRTSTQKRRSAKLDTSHLSEAPKTRNRATLAIEAPPSPPKVARKKRWNKTELDRLKVALRAAGSPRSLQDWEKIANSISGGDRSAEECREQAEKLRLWKPDIDAGNEHEACRKHKICKDDYFADKTYGDITLLDLNPDDSLLSVLKTPTEPVKFSRKPPMLRQVLNETQYTTRSSFNDSI